jgi:uncharacterized protein
MFPEHFGLTVPVSGDEFVWLLAALFFFVAFAYSSVGLGGGSSYTALLSIAGVSFVAIPTISLILNLVVTSVGSFNFARQKHVRIKLLWPFLVLSIPMAYVGGSLDLSQSVFEWTLLVSLILVVVRIYVVGTLNLSYRLPAVIEPAVPFFLGGMLGLLAGIVGIGGGIFLVPVILLFNLGSEKEAAATGAIFIFANSLVGVVARVQFHGIEWLQWWPLMVAVLFGGAVGSFMGAARFSPRTIQKNLGLVILIAIVLLARRTVFG